MTENLKAVIFFVLLCLPSLYAQADGIVVDKVYHPYVDALEKEMEYRTVIQDEQEGLAHAGRDTPVCYRHLCW